MKTAAAYTKSAVRVAAKSPSRRAKPHLKAVEHARQEIRRELIRRVVAEMVQTGF